MSDTIEAEVVLCVQNEEFNAELGNDRESGNFTPSENAIKEKESCTSEKDRNEEDANNSCLDITLGSPATSAEAEDIIGQEKILDTSSHVPQSGVKGKDTGLLSLLSSMEQEVPSRQIQSDYDIKKVAKIADTMLVELNKGEQIMLNASNHFRNAKSNSAVSNIDGWKLILFAIMEHLQQSSKNLDNKVRNKFKKLEESLTEISRILLHVQINARIGANMYNDILRKNKDKFNCKTSGSSEPRKSVSDIKIKEEVDEPAPLTGIILELSKESNELEIRDLDHQQTVYLKDLNLDQKHILLSAVIDEVNKLSELSLSDLQNLSIYVTEIKNTVKYFGKPKTCHLKGSIGGPEYSLESSIIKLHHQIEAKSGVYYHHSIEQALVDQLKSVAREMDFFIKFNQSVTEYFRKQQEAFKNLKTEKKILKWKVFGSKATWPKNENHIEQHLTTLNDPSVLFRLQQKDDLLSVGSKDVIILDANAHFGAGEDSWDAIDVADTLTQSRISKIYDRVKGWFSFKK